jgi:hypothetical protein
LAPVLLGPGEPLLHGLDLHALGFCLTNRKVRNTQRTLYWRRLQYRANDEGRQNESQKGQVPADGFVVSFGDGMNRTPIASALLFVGRDATEAWYGSDDEYREVGISSGNQALTKIRVCRDQSVGPNN